MSVRSGDPSADPECTVWCRSGDHAMQLMAAISGRPPTDWLKTFCRHLCHNFPLIVDSFGRNVLHLGASCGDSSLVEWLLTKCHSEPDIKDLESGWTALHRSIFYGQMSCANTLIKFGANLNVLDRNYCTPLDLLMLDRPPYIDYKRTDPCDCYVWGSNDNFNLGVETEHSRHTPEVINTFERETIHIKEVLIRKFHTLFLSNDGKVLSCGHGHGGRLGHDSEDLLITPKAITILNDNLFCESIASGQDHFLLLVRHLKDNTVHIYSCGMNTYHVLGHIPTPEKLLVPQMISLKHIKLGPNHRLGDIIGVGAARYHSLFYTKEELFTFGLNVGQIGHSKGERLQTIPHKVSALAFKDTETKFEHIVTSDGAIVCATNRGEVFVLHEYQCRKVASKQLDIQQICVVGGHLDERTDVAGIHDNSRLELQIILLTKMSKIYLWKGSDPVLVRCLIGFGRELFVTHICLNVSAVGIVTKDGEVFFGSVSNRKSIIGSDSKKSNVSTVCTPVLKSSSKALQVKSFVTFIDRDECHTIRVKKQNHIHRAVAIFSDDKNRNFAVLQSSPKIGLLETASKPDSQMNCDMRSLFERCYMNDNTHDVVINVGNRQYFAHKFVLANRSEYFRKKFSSDCDCNSMTIETNFVSADCFDQIIRFIYYNSNDMFEDGKRINWTQGKTNSENSLKTNDNNMNQKSKNSNKKKETKKSKSNSSNDLLNELRDGSKKLGIVWFHKWLTNNGVKIVDNKVKVIDKCLPPKLSFDRFKYDLYDIIISSEDGIEFKCHKCILMSRIEYFRGMLSSGWIETSTNSALTLPISSKILNIIMDYVYSDQLSKLESIEDPEFICQVLVIADQYLIPRLKTYCEYILVNLLSLKNGCELLELSYIYNADQLRRCCLDFICINLQTLIENKSIDILSDEAMVDLTECYQNLITRPHNRRIVRHSNAPEDQELQKIYSLFGSNDDFNVNIEEKKAILKQRSNELKRIKRSNRQRIESNSSDITESEDSNSLQISKLSLSSPKQESDSQLKKCFDSEVKQNSIEFNSSKTMSLSEFQSNSELSVKHKPIKWGLSSSTKVLPISFKDIITEEETKFTKINKSMASVSPNTSKQSQTIRQNAIPIPKSVVRNRSSKSNETSLSLESNSPKSFAQMAVSPPKLTSNPWKKIGSTSPTAFDHSFVAFDPQLETISMKDIVREEEQQIENLKALQTKPLHVISIEDKAIEELLHFYRANGNPEEYITVERVTTRLAEPVWSRNQ